MSDVKITACIFDLDGVLTDTAHYHFLAWKQVATKLEFELTLEQNEALKPEFD
ncbi:MAG: beta-phosphoglucomutase [Bacteroidia bacterium]|jgi:beta-phosphoglucomutase